MIEIVRLGKLYWMMEKYLQGYQVLRWRMHVERANEIASGARE